MTVKHLESESPASLFCISSRHHSASKSVERETTEPFLAERITAWPSRRHPPLPLHPCRYGHTREQVAILHFSPRNKQFVRPRYRVAWDEARSSHTGFLSLSVLQGNPANRRIGSMKLSALACDPSPARGPERNDARVCGQVEQGPVEKLNLVCAVGFEQT